MFREKICTFADVGKGLNVRAVLFHLIHPNARGKKAEFNLSISTIMAKSKSGGTRAYIRGRVGSDVYSVGKTAKGKKQQVVRSLAETVANPQTESQMFGRMIMSTVMQTVSALRPIIDHSFDNVTGKQPNISEFISRNYGLIKADAIAHPASGNKFGLNKYQEKGAKFGQYVIAAGEVPTPAGIAYSFNDAALPIALSSSTFTFGGLKAKLGLSGGDYLTILGYAADGNLRYERYQVAESVSDDTAITGANIGNMLVAEGTGAFIIAIDDVGYKVNIMSQNNLGAAGVILSVNTTSGWKHNDAVMVVSSTNNWAADDALPTYPTGSEQFLNGGDIF